MVRRDGDQTSLGKSNVLINEKSFGFAFSFKYFSKHIHYFKIKTRSFTFLVYKPWKVIKMYWLMKLSDKSIVREEGNGCKDAMNNCLSSLCSLRNKATRKTKPYFSGFSLCKCWNSAKISSLRGMNHCSYLSAYQNGIYGLIMLTFFHKALIMWSFIWKPVGKQSLHLY